ncbi:MAG: hypothetical protein O2986_05575 [Actinomycetota bacterium]|nr:hypothetical protein [Actinomycetota bacterium]
MIAKKAFVTALAMAASLLGAGCSEPGPMYSGWEEDMIDFLFDCTEPVAGLFEEPVVAGSDAWAAATYYCNDVWKYYIHPDIGRWLDDDPETYTGPGYLYSESGAGLAIIAGVRLSD